MAISYIEKYGKQFIRECIDLILINQGNISPEKMREILIEHGLIKKTTKTVRPRLHSNRVSRESYRDPVTGQWRFREIEPYTTYSFYAVNGRNQQIFSVYFKSNQIGELLEELENDTTTN